MFVRFSAVVETPEENVPPHSLNNGMAVGALPKCQRGGDCLNWSANKRGWNSKVKDGCGQPAVEGPVFHDRPRSGPWCTQENRVSLEESASNGGSPSTVDIRATCFGHMVGISELGSDAASIYL